MSIYAQIDESGICIGIAQLAGEVSAPHMISIPDYDEKLFGKFWDGATFIYPPIPTPTLDSAKAAKTKAIRDYFELVVQSIKAAAAPYEIATWETQRTEYMAWQANNATPTPFVSALAAARGLTVPELMAKIAPKVAGFATIQGTQHRLEKLVEAATTIAEVDAITW